MQTKAYLLLLIIAFVKLSVSEDPNVSIFFINIFFKFNFITIWLRKGHFIHLKFEINNLNKLDNSLKIWIFKSIKVVQGILISLVPVTTR